MSADMIRVLDLRDSPWIDGPGRTILQCADMIDSSQCKIIIGAFSGKSHKEHAYLNQAIKLDLEVIPITENSSFDIGVVKQINQAIRDNSIDIIHVHDFRSNLYGLICAKAMGIPIVSTCHGWISNNMKGKLYTLLDRFLLRFHNKIITVSNTMKDQLVKSEFKEDRITVINNALVVDDYIINRDDQKFRNEYFISKNKIVVANIGRLSPEKGQDIFLKSAKNILTKNNDLIFVLIGIGQEEESLTALVNQLGITDNVIFTGYREDMIDIYNSVDLVVQSSSTEGMPNVILESLLMGIPVIATDVGGTSQIVEHRVNGFLIDAQDISALNRAMSEFVDNRNEFINMGLAGREHIINNFNQDSRVDKLNAVYKSLIS